MILKLQRVAVRNARFYAPIGFFSEEQILGNEFFVTIEVSFLSENEDAEDLSNTVNYAILYDIASAVMQQPRKLIESAANDILKKIQEKFDFLETINVRILKKNPPFGGDVADAEIEISIHNPPKQ